MKSLKRQAGNGALIAILLAGVLALGSTVYYETRSSQLKSARATNESSAEELRQISSALTKYYSDNLAWPASLNELSSSGYFNGDAGRCGGAGVFQSPQCTVIFGNQVGDDYALTVNLLKDGIAQAVASQVPGGTVAGSTVTATINRPFQSALYDDYLQKVEDPDRPERTQVEVDLDINGNDINNVNSLNAAKVIIENAVFNTADINSVTTERIDLGANSLTHVGNQLNLNAAVVSINGTLSINGNVVGNSNDLSGFDTVSANTGDFTDLNATTGNIKTLSGNALDYKSGSIDTINGNSLSYTNGSITSLDGNNLDYNTGTISSLTGNNINFSAGSIGNLSGNNVSFLSGLINVLNGNTLTFTNVNGTTGNFNSLNSNDGTIANMEVTGSSSFHFLNSSKANITTVTATDGSIVVGTATSASGNSLSSSGNSSFGRLDSERIETSSFSGKSVTTGSGSVLGNASVGTLSVARLNVSDRIQTNAIDSSSSSLGNASASDVSISGRLIASGVNTSTASFDIASIRSVSSNNVDYNTISASRFNGGNYTSSDDFYTPVSSVNNNHLLIEEQKYKLANCVDVTKFCLPETPSVTLTCPTCKVSAGSSSFSGVATASISGCRQGCSYSWVTTGSDLSFSGCINGTIAKGGAANPSCSVSASLGPEEGALGNIKLVVTNSHYTSASASANVNISFYNITTRNPLDAVRAGCFVDTYDFDTVSSTACSAFFYAQSAPSSRSILFSVGDTKNSRRDLYIFSDPNWSVTWSGGCVGSGSSCSTKWTNRGQTIQVSATATVIHLESGRQKVFSVTATVTVEK